MDSNIDDNDFYDENQEHLDLRRAELDEARESNEANRSHESYWMKCPKCGGQMLEINLMNIIVDGCTNCKGLFFDNGELNTLLEIDDRKGFFQYYTKKNYN